MDFETEKTDEEIYYNTHGQDRELFLAQVRHFREIMCSTQYDFERKDKEWGYVIEAYVLDSFWIFTPSLDSIAW